MFGKLPFKYSINKGYLKAWASTKLKLTLFVLAAQKLTSFVFR